MSYQAPSGHVWTPTGMPPAVGVPRYPSTLANSAMARGLTFSGMILFLIGLSIAASGFGSLRLEFGGTMVHPYLLILAPIAPIILLFRLGELPKGLLIGMTFFLGIYALAALQGSGAVGEILKVGASICTVFVTALCVRSKSDFLAGTLGICIALTLLSVRAIISGGSMATGANPLDVANENAYSLYALPPFLLGGYAILDKTNPKWFRYTLMFCVGMIGLSLLLSANRSGWLGMALVAVLLVGKGQRLRALFLFGFLGLVSVYVLFTFFSTEHITYATGQTVAGDTSDNFRLELIMATINIGLDNPVLGVGPTQLREVIPEYVERPGRRHLESHNLPGHIIGGTGFITMLMLCGTALLLYLRPIQQMGLAKKPISSAHRLLRIAIILWAVRSLFSQEILYSPTFSMLIGMCVGLCMVEGVWSSKPQQAPRPVARPGARPAPRPI